MCGVSKRVLGKAVRIFSEVFLFEAVPCFLCADEFHMVDYLCLIVYQISYALDRCIIQALIKEDGDTDTVLSILDDILEVGKYRIHDTEEEQAGSYRCQGRQCKQFVTEYVLKALLEGIEK